MRKNRGTPKRIDVDLEKLIEEIANKNEMNFRQASRELAKSFENQFRGKKKIAIREIRF